MMQGYEGGRLESMNAEDIEGKAEVEEHASGAKVVCIAVQDDGTFSVYQEDQPDGAQVLGSADEALQAAKGMLTPGGEDPQAIWDEMAAKRDESRGMM